MSNIIQISAESELSDIVQLRHVTVEPIKLGQKRAQPIHTQAEEEELQSLYDQLRQQLSVPRIDRLDGRALGVWDKDANAVRVLRKDGKFGSFGFSRDGQHYLEYFEALFLLEMNRLQLEYHSMVMSIEQAYLLLLGENTSPKYNEYLVYSHLSRAGYILVKHQNLRFSNPTTQPLVTTTDCIWEILLNAIQNKTIPEHVKHSTHYTKTKESMDAIKASLVQQVMAVELPETSQSQIVFEGKCQPPNGKRKTDDCYNVPAKKPCTSHSCGSLLDTLKSDEPYKRFADIFQRLELISLHEPSFGHQVNARTFRINFDVHLHNAGFRKSSPKPPAFRVIVLDTHESFPNHNEIALCFQQQLVRVPLLVAAVNESKQVHAFIYHFNS